jgi:hypothetical protein
VPSEDCLRRDEERSPALTGYESGQEGDEGTVGPGEAGTGDLAAEHGELVAQDKDLWILGGIVHPEDPEQFDDAADQAVEKAERHGRKRRRTRPAWSRRRSSKWTLQAEDVDHKGDIDEARVGLHIGEVGHPEPVGRRRAEVPIDEVSGSRQQLVGDGRLPAPAPANPGKARGRHEPLDRAAGHAHFLPVELGPDLVGAVDAVVGLVDPGDLDLQLFVAQRPRSRRPRP